MMRLWAGIALFLTAVGCAAPKRVAYAPETSGYADFEADGFDEPEAERAVMSVAGVQPGQGGGPDPATISPVMPASERMVHYDGFARLRATQPSETLDQVATLAEEAGGRVDRLSDSSATVRVPVDQFDPIWAAVLELGDVLVEQVRADDVTDQFRATDLRVKTLETMQARLVRLLGRAKSEEEKLALLQQITRVTEELDRTESRMRVLRDLASMSRISVEVLPREFGPGRGELTLAGFEWIRNLSPFQRSVWDDDKRIDLDTPEEMVALTKKGPYVAESSDLTVLWTMRVDNDPRGDADFWRSAIRESLAGDFVRVEASEVGDFACLSLDEPGSDEPYRWLVCLATTERHVHVVQAYFPGPTQVERFAERIDAALAGGGDA